MKGIKAWFGRCPRLHLWLGCAAALCAAFHLAKHSRPLMNFLAVQVAQPVKEALGALSALAPFSVAEVLIAAALGALALYLAALPGALLRRRTGRAALLYRRLAGLGAVLLSVYAALCLLWGVNYYADSFQQRAGIRTGPVSVAELTRTTAYFAAQLNETSAAVARDESGAFSVPRDAIYGEAAEIYRGAEARFPFLAMEDHTPKRVSFSRLMSAANFTGFFFPFTGEANLNDDSPACLLPATIAHEMAHQRGVASEDECNFLAVLACEESGSAVYAYSGWLFGFIHLSNALYSADPAAWEAVHAALDDRVRMDLAVNNAYWAQFSGPAADLSQDAYDGFLKSYGEQEGVRSYGAVVDLLVAWYGPRAAQ